jgi:hypothetical protein
MVFLILKIINEHFLSLIFFIIYLSMTFKDKVVDNCHLNLNLNFDLNYFINLAYLQFNFITNFFNPRLNLIILYLFIIISYDYFHLPIYLDILNYNYYFDKLNFYPFIFNYLNQFNLNYFFEYYF